MCVTLPCMYTQTQMYRDIDLGRLYVMIDGMEQKGWSVRQTTVLEDASDKMIDATSEKPPHLQRRISVLVTYEREVE